jgi:hypothetical protein
MTRTLVVILAALALLGVAAFAYIKLSGSAAPRPIAPAVTQKSSAPPAIETLPPNETQVMGLTFNMTDAGAPYALTVSTITYTDLLDTAQVSSVSVSGSIVDAHHPIKFWQKPRRFSLLNQVGQPYPAKLTVRPVKGGFSYNVVFSKVSIAVLKAKQANLVIPTPPQANGGGTALPAEPIVIGVVPDRFRFGA